MEHIFPPRYRGYSSGDDITTFRRLWELVLLQGVEDIINRCPQLEDNSRKAKKWMSLNNPDFLQVCELAAYDPVIVVQLIEGF